MRRTRSLAFALFVLGMGTISSIPPALAAYGYQCFKDYARNEYCSCTNFGNHKQASAWIGSVVTRTGNKMKPSSDWVIHKQPPNCTP